VQIEDIRERKTAEHILLQQSYRDPLTGLYNRRYLDATMEREVHRAQRQGTSIGVMMVDIDDFKRLNDTHGHRAGDELLRTIGTMLQEQTRHEDIACRYGGEEFCLVLPGAVPEVLQQRAEMIRAVIKTVQLLEHTLPDPVTCSIGLAVFPKHGSNIIDVIEAADQALYAAKRAGRDRVILTAHGTATTPSRPTR
jgi:diguanylate cyclase (GGDEF)-like protein